MTSFTQSADALASGYDVMMCYQIMLGRDPETSFVIEEAKTQPIGSVLMGFFRSDEFTRQVARRLAGGERLPHDASSRGPSTDQVAWLLRQIAVDDEADRQLRDAKGWPAFLGVLSEVMTSLRAEVPADLASVREAVAALEAKFAKMQEEIANLRAELTTKNRRTLTQKQ